MKPNQFLHLAKGFFVFSHNVMLFLFNSLKCHYYPLSFPYAILFCFYLVRQISYSMLNIFFFIEFRKRLMLIFTFFLYLFIFILQNINFFFQNLNFIFRRLYFFNVKSSLKLLLKLKNLFLGLGILLVTFPYFLIAY